MPENSDTVTSEPGPLVDISDIIVSEATVSELQGNQLWMRPEVDVGH